MLNTGGKTAGLAMWKRVGAATVQLVGPPSSHQLSKGPKGLRSNSNLCAFQKLNLQIKPKTTILVNPLTFLPIILSIGVGVLVLDREDLKPCWEHYSVSLNKFTQLVFYSPQE